MNLSWIDWAIMLVAVIVLRLVSLSTRSHMKGVADFLSANRSAGRYLLTIASQMGGTGAISIVALFEMYYQAGFPTIWWGFMLVPINAIIVLMGWVFYRFRETRALTMAQFFEMRYSRKFRVFAGFLCWACGILNFGIFPAVAARFFIYFCGLPDQFYIPGVPEVLNIAIFGFSLHLHSAISTFASVMILDLGLALMFVLMGGQISIMVTECVQGIFSSIAFVIIAISMMLVVSWPKIIAALSTAPVNASMMHPMHTSAVKDFNIWFFLIAAFGAFYNFMSWQGTSGFNSSARTPHEQKMGGIIAIWRSLPQGVMTLILPIAAFAIMNLPEYAHQAAIINTAVDKISNPAIQTQMRVPIILAHILPIGIKGLFVTTMLFFSFTCHDTYMHSWGSIFIQDVVMPFRKRAMEPAQHILWLRWSIVGVAVFAFLFSLLYPQTQKILMFFAITGTIWLGGSGAVVIGGLYWKRGTTAGAYCALILGAVLGVSGLIIPGIYKNHYHTDFPINGQWLMLIGMVGASLTYIIVSLITSSKANEFNLDRMLFRGKYAPANGNVTAKHESRLMRFVGINKEFSFGDRILTIALLVWNFGWFTFFAIVTVVNLIWHIGNPWWSNFWRFYIWLYIAIGVPATIWFTIGGIMDIKGLFRILDKSVRDHTDDGRVVRESDLEAAKELEMPALQDDSGKKI